MALAKSTKQNIIVITVALAVVLCSTIGTLVITGAFDGSGADQGYKNITFTDASMRCEKETRETFGKPLAQMHVDNHSSRYDEKANAFKIFLQADVRDKKNKITMYYVSCYVSSSRGRITKYETFENKESTGGGAIKKSGGKFIEWPR